MKKRQTYDQDLLRQAVEAVKGGMPAYAASKKFNVPRSTIRDKVSGKTSLGKRTGPAPILTKEEEGLTVKWILEMEKSGFPITKSQLVESVALLMKQLKKPNNFRDGIPGRHWFELFLKRNPEVAQRVSQNLTACRTSITETAIRSWFSRIRSFIAEENVESIFEDASRIYNCDEAAFFMCPKEKSVLIKKGSKQVYNRIANDEKECLTVLVTISAAGELAPPLMLYTDKRIPMNIISTYPKDWGMGRSENGWMTCQTFFEYISNVFYPWLQKTNKTFPICLFMDGHSSHLSLPLAEFCRDHKIILIALLPNATHLLKPLDVAVFHPLKTEWKNMVREWKVENKTLKLGRDCFAPLLEKCLSKAVKTETVISGFRTTGLYPFDENRIDYSKLFI